MLAPGAPEILWLKRTDLPPRLMALLLDLQCYRFEFVANRASTFLQPRAPLSLGDDPDVAVSRPDPDAVGRFIRKRFTGPRVQVNFDGGLHKIGFAVYDVAGCLVHAFGSFDALLYPTNNMAELSALQAAITYLTTAAAHAHVTAAAYIEVRGDSDLAIKFMNRVYTPKRPGFVAIVDQLRALIRGARLTVQFVHIPRAENAIADLLGRLAERVVHDVGLDDLLAELGPASDPAPTAGGGVYLVVAPAVADDELLDQPCEVCGGTEHPQSMLVCDICRRVTHLSCAGHTTVPRGFWYCR